MIDMFTNYQNLSEYYTPNNLAKYQQRPCSYTKFNSNNITYPYELYNAKGELEGYFWHYGDQIELAFELSGELTLENETGTGEYVDITDFIKDKVFTFRLFNFRHEIIYEITKPGTQVMLAPNCPLGDGIIDIPTPTLSICIDSELSKKLVKGIYYCSLIASGESFKETLFDTSDCKLLVK